MTSSVASAELVRLHWSRSERELYQCFSECLEQALGSSACTVLNDDGACLQVVHSSVLRRSKTRLEAPTISPVQLRELRETLASAPGGGALDQAPASVDVEGQELTVYELLELDARDERVGYLLLHDRRTAAAGEEQRSAPQPGAVETELLANFAVALRRHRGEVRLHEETDHLQAKLSAINEIGELLGSLDLEVLLNKLMELSLYVVSGQVGSIILLREDPEEGLVEESPIEWGLPLEMARCFQTSDGRSIFEIVIESGHAVAATDFTAGADYRIVAPDVHVDSYLCVPLISKSRTLGAVNLVNSAFSPTDREVLMTICGLAATTIENAMLYEASLEKERYAASLKIAHDIQQRLYPSRAPELGWLEIASRTEPCDETGGDYFDFITAPDDAGLTMVIGDVSGHGIGAALHMVAARSGLRATIGEGVALEETFCRLNDHLEQDMEVDQFMTMFMASFRPGQPLSFVNAGHDAPCVYRAATGEVEELTATGIPLGLFPGHPYELGEAAPLMPGDVFLAMTDGVWEVNSPDGVMLGKEGITEVFRDLARSTDSPDEIAGGIIERVGTYTAHSPARDDVTLVVVRAATDPR